MVIDYQAIMNQQLNWIAQSQRPSGAIPFTATKISPYYGNIAATALAMSGRYQGAVKSWIAWYVAHLAWPNKYNLHGVIFDWNIAGGNEISANDCDSTDSYAATFLTLCRHYYFNGDAQARQYIQSIQPAINAIAGVLIATRQADGLTWAKPDYKLKYLMDNCEVYCGLRDYAILSNALGSSNAYYWDGQAYGTRKQLLLMLTATGWAPAKDGAGTISAPNPAVWYPDMTAQLFPVLCGVTPPDDNFAYITFDKAFPNWPTTIPDSFPWVVVACGAAMMRDYSSVNSYIANIQARFSAGYKWPWYCAEAGWMVRLCRYMLGGRPL